MLADKGLRYYSSPLPPESFEIQFEILKSPTQ